MDSTLNRSNQNTPTPKLSLRNRAARLFSDQVTASTIRAILPIPGLHELTSIAETLIDDLQDSPYELNRCSTLALKIRHFTSIAADMAELDPNCVQELKRDLEETTIAFGAASSPGRLDFGKAKRNIQVIEDLERKVDALVKLTKMRLQVQLALAHQDNGLKTIEAHEIRDQKILPPTHSQWEYRQRLVFFERESVTICDRSSRIGRLPVVYRTYCSSSATDTEKYLRRELNMYSQCLHTNVATVMGVTKGPRLNGVVFASAALSYEEFLSQVSSPTALVRCIRGYYSASSYFNNLDFMTNRLYPGVVRIELDGHVIVTPTDNIGEGIQLPKRALSMKNLDPAVRIALQVIDICQPDNIISKFLDLMAQCPGRLTELKVLELADAANALPIPALLMLTARTRPPSFALQVGDVGTYIEESHNSFEWFTFGCSQMAKDQFELTIGVMRDGQGSSRSIPNNATVGEDGWHTYELPRGCVDLPLELVMTRVQSNRLGWKSLIAGWTGAVNRLPSQIQLESICLCSDLTMIITVRQRGSLPDNKIYFHRRPSARSDPQAFWGYFSSNMDPTAREDNLENKGWIINYHLRALVCRVVDGWGYKYKQLLKQGIKSIPGSFPGIETESSSDGEDD